MTNTIELVIVTGMSGAGKTVAIQSFEDLGYFTIDNMPPALVPKFLELVENNGEYDKVALVIDMRSRLFFKEVQATLDQIELTESINLRILFLDAVDGELVSRYKETRRSHPLAPTGRVLDGITLERELLAPLKSLSQHVVDTTELTPRQLRKVISEEFSDDSNQNSFRIEVMSFGFKYGLPQEADIVFDVRCLPNPFYVPELKEKTGLDQEVVDYVMKFPESQELLRRIESFLEYALPLYVKEGKSQLMIAIGCTGGKHRSITFARKIGEYCTKLGYQPSVQHRDARRTA